MSTKECSGFFPCLDFELFAKIEKRLGFYALAETIFIQSINNSRSKQNNKNSKHAFVDICK